MLVAELDEVADVRRAAVDPVTDVVHVGEFGVGAAGEPAPLVTPPDLQPLGVRRIAPCPPEVEALPSGIVSGDQDLGVARQPPSDLPRQRPEHVELGSAVAPGQEAQVGVDHDSGSVAVRTTGPGLRLPG